MRYDTSRPVMNVKVHFSKTGRGCPQSQELPGLFIPSSILQP
jgi:hypothetical protein